MQILTKTEDKDNCGKMKQIMKPAFHVPLLVAIAAASINAQAVFQCEVQVPVGGVGALRTAPVTYFNDGTSAIAAPHVRLEASANAYARFSETDTWSKSVEFLATSEQSPASSLRAGEPVDVGRGAVFIYLTLKGLPPHARSIEVLWP